MKKYGKTAVGAVLAVLLLTGCGEAKIPKTIDSSMLSVSKNGEVTAYLVEDFAKSYYDISELTSMAVEEAAQFNTVNQTGDTIPVKVEQVEALTDGTNRVKVIYQYDSTDSYSAFNEEPLFYGTVGEAVLKGYSTKVILGSVKDGTLFTEEQLKQATEKRLLIAPAGVYVYCPGKVEYISEGATVAEDGSVDTTQADEYVYILLK